MPRLNILFFHHDPEVQEAVHDLVEKQPNFRLNQASTPEEVQTLARGGSTR